MKNAILSQLEADLFQKNTKLESLLAECREVLEFYGGNFDGKDGSGWTGNVFHTGTLIGTRELDPSTKAREMLEKLKEVK